MLKSCSVQAFADLECRVQERASVQPAPVGGRKEQASQFPTLQSVFVQLLNLELADTWVCCSILKFFWLVSAITL